MDGLHEQSVEKVGKTLGYALSYVIFTTILFFMLSFLGKIPQEWSILHMGMVTAPIALVGLALRWLLK